MHIKNFLRITAALLLMISLAGCGNSDTNGTVELILEAPVNAGIVFFKATAKVTPGRTGSLVGIPIYFTAVQMGTDPSTNSIFTQSVSSGELKTDISGTRSWSYNFQQKTFDTSIQVTVTADGVQRIEKIDVL